MNRDKEQLAFYARIICTCDTELKVKSRAIDSGPYGVKEPNICLYVEPCPKCFKLQNALADSIKSLDPLLYGRRLK